MFGQTRIDRFDMRLERTPALEAIVVGNGELRLIQPCGGLRPQPVFYSSRRRLQLRVAVGVLRCGRSKFSAIGPPAPNRASSAAWPSRRRDPCAAHAPAGAEFIAKPSNSALTPREAVLRQVSIGLTLHETAKALGLGDETIRSHFKKAQVKLGTRNRTHTVAEAMRELLII